MSVLDNYKEELKTVLRKIIDYPHRTERNVVLDELIRYLASVRGSNPPDYS